MNWEIICTALGLGIVFILLSPLYLALFATTQKIRMKSHLEFYIASATFDRGLEEDEIDTALNQIFKGE